MGLGMDERPPEDTVSAEGAAAAAARDWDTARRVREPVAWTLLVLTAFGVLVSTWQLFGLDGTPAPAVPVPGPGPVQATTFALRASALAPGFVAAGIVVLPVLSVILVAFTGGRTGRARQVVQTAVTIQGVGLGLGLISWLAAFGTHTRPGIWFVAIASDLAIAATALVFTAAVLLSQALRKPPPQQFQDFEDEDDDDFADEEVGEWGEDFGEESIGF